MDRFHLPDQAGLICYQLEKIKTAYQVRCNLHDIAGLRYGDQALRRRLSPYLFHNNPFCNLVKKSPAGLAGCVACKNRVYQKLLAAPVPFYGPCPLGLEELVVPVLQGRRLLAFLCFGEFCARPERRLCRTIQAVSSFGIAPAACQRTFMETVRPPLAMLDRLLCDALLLARLLSDAYRATLPMADDQQLLQSCVDFIHDHYAAELSLPLIAAGCYCNPSYLSHLFKKRMGLGINEYIRGLRMEKAKELLYITNLSVTQIAHAVGFQDSGYFSKVFFAHTGCRPAQYRKSPPQI